MINPRDEYLVNKGREEGREKGKKEGREEGKQEIAKKLLEKMTLKEVAEITGLKEEEINNLI